MWKYGCWNRQAWHPEGRTSHFKTQQWQTQGSTNHNVPTGHTKNGEESNAEGGSRESIDDITTYPCQGMEGTSANNHLAVRNATKNHDNAATTTQGSYNKSQDGTNQIQEDMNERAIYQHESANLLNTIQAIASTGQAGLQAISTANAPRNARAPLPPRPSGASQCPSRAIRQSLPNAGNHTQHGGNTQAQQQGEEPTITLNTQQINDMLARVVESTLRGWKDSNTGMNNAQVQSEIMASGKSKKLLNGASLHRAGGFSGLSMQDPVSDMLHVLDSNKHKTVKLNTLKKKLHLAQWQNPMVIFMLWKEMVNDFMKHQFNQEEHDVGFHPFLSTTNG